MRAARAALFCACAAGAVAGQVIPAEPSPVVAEGMPDLIRVTRNELTGEVTEWWFLGPDAAAREHDLRAAHEPGEVVRAGGNPPRAAAWFGPGGERLAEDAVTLRYRPNGRELPPGQRGPSVARARLRLVSAGGEP